MLENGLLAKSHHRFFDDDSKLAIGGWKNKSGNLVKANGLENQSLTEDSGNLKW